MGRTHRLAAMVCLMLFGAALVVGCGSVNAPGRTSRRVAPINMSDPRMMEAQLRDRHQTNNNVSLGR
jgi:hypothetical protein